MIDIINKLRQILPPRYKAFALLLAVLMGVSAVFELCALGMLMPIVLTVSNLDSLQGDGYLARFYQYLGSPSLPIFITALAVFFLLFFLLKTLFNYFSIWSQSFFTAKMTTVLTERLITKYVAAPYSFHVNTGAVELINRLQSIGILLMKVCQSLLLVFSESLVVFSLTVAITVMMPQVAAVLIGVGISSFFLYIPIKRVVERLGKEQFEWNEEYNRAMFQAFGTIKEVKLSANEKYFVDSITNSRWNLCKAEKKSYDMAQLPRLMVEMFAVVIAMGILILLVNIDTDMSDILMIAAIFIAAMFRIMPSLTRIQYNTVYARGGSFILQKLHHDLTSLGSEPVSQSDTPVDFCKELSVENISFAYDQNHKPVLKDFSLRIKRNESVALVGPSGSGKTTLIDLLMGFQQPSAGYIKADGQDIFCNLRDWRRKIGYVSQHVYLINDTIRANIAFCRGEGIDDDKVCRVMRMAQIFDFVQTLPDKENTVVGEMGVKLSGGQRQRIAIARALYREPELLVLDEATSALDNETEKAFVDALHTLKGSLTIIMIAHRLSSTEYCDRSISLEQV